MTNLYIKQKYIKMKRFFLSLQIVEQFLYIISQLMHIHIYKDILDISYILIQEARIKIRRNNYSSKKSDLYKWQLS